MARKQNSRKSKSAPQADERIYDAARFRRLIHAQGNLAAGLNRNRKAVALEAIAGIVGSLMPNAIYRNLLAPDPFPNAYAKVKAGRVLAQAETGFELVWTASVLSYYKEQIAEYLKLKDLFSKAYLGANYAFAAEMLGQLQDKFGLSLWLTSARLGLAQLNKGLARQKEILNTIVYEPGIDALFAYLAFFFSYSLEEGVTISDIRREFAFDSNIADYCRYHVSPFDLDAITEPGNCISVESNSPIIDRFETLIDMMLLAYLRRQHLGEIKQAIELLRSLHDPRLSSLEFCLFSPGKEPTEDVEFLKACDEYSIGEYAGAAETISTILERDPSAAWVYELAARNDQALSIPRSTTSLANVVISETRAYLELSKDLSIVRSALLRHGFQTRKLLASRTIAALLDRVLDIPIDANFSAAQGFLCLSSPLVQPSNYGILNRVDPAAYRRLAKIRKGSKSASDLINRIAIGHGDEERPEMQAIGIPPKRLSLYLAYSFYNEQNYSAASRHYEHYRAISPERTSPRTLTFQYALHRRQQLLGDALKGFVDAYFENPRYHSLYSMEEFASWAVAHAAANAESIDRSILLHVYSTNYGSGHDGDLSDALEDILDNFDVEVLSGLIKIGLERHRCVYVLRYVANVDRLEDTTRFASLDEIEAERITILQWLVQNDPSHRNAYTQEISSITKDQEVARLSAQFERSKIYVHEEGIRRTFDAEIRPHFFRYRQLLSDPEMGVQVDQIEQRIRKLLKDSDSEFSYLVIPSTERDSIYFAMIQRAYHILVLDPNHGFKTYLSTRILHGILEGELRASFVNEGLLVSIDGSAKEQEVLERWREQLDRFDETTRAEVAKHVVRFSERVTEAISYLKDRRIRVFSKEMPEGLFAIGMSGPSFDRLKQSITSTTTYGEFFDRLLIIFWESVEECLREVKFELSGRFQKQVVGAFDSLEAGLSMSELGVRPVELLDAIARCRASFGVDLERVSAWFARAGVMAREPFLAGTAIRVAERITNNCYPQHPLNVDTSEAGVYEIAGDLLNPLVDLLTNCFQNAAEHSGVAGRSPTVAVAVNRPEAGDLEFSVSSELSDQIDADLCLTEMEDLLNEEEANNPSAVAGEGRTGIRKMKRILRHDFQSEKKMRIEISSGKLVVVSFSVPGGFVRERAYH